MKKSVFVALAMFTAFQAHSTIYYVSAAMTSDAGDGTSWTTAKKTIQAAVDLTASGDTIIVTNGTYNVGTTVTPGNQGILTPIKSDTLGDYAAGLGFCLIPDNDPALKVNNLKRSYPATLETVR